MHTRNVFKSSLQSEPRSGSALVIVLGLLSVLMLMGVAFAVTMRTERMGASNMRHAALARHILDSAMARVMSDLDFELRSYEDNGHFYGAIVPDDMVVLASEDENADSVITLTHEIARHLSSDQLVAALKTPAAWKPIYGGVSISDVADGNPMSEDPPVGRYAYIVLNGCGTLDPNLVGGKDRENGLSIEEIQLGRTSGEKLLDDPLNGTVAQFLKKRKEAGHYATMRDFWGSGITNIVANPKVKPSNTAMKFATNSFAIGTMAIEDYAPPTEVDGAKFSKVDNNPNTTTVYRRPKVSLVDEDGKLLDISSLSTAEAKNKAVEIAEAFENAFGSTYRTDSDTESKKAFRKQYTVGTNVSSPKTIPTALLAARILLDAMDDDLIPGGSTKHDIFEIGKKSSSSFADKYIEMMTGEKHAWDRFPCTEPVPMLDNLVLVGGTDTEPNFITSEPLRFTDEYGNLVTTGMQWTVTIGAALNSVYYPGWNVPEVARKEFRYEWNFRELTDPLWEYTSNVDPADEAAFKTEFEKMAKNNADLDACADNTFSPWKGNEFSPQRRAELTDIKEVFQFTLKLPMNKDGTAPKLPEKIGFRMYAFGVVMQGGDDNIVQVAPCMSGSDNVDRVGQDSKVELNVVIDTTVDYKEGDFPVLAATVCVDPMFAYNRFSWISTLAMDEEPDDNEPLSRLCEYLTKFSSFDDYLQEQNPLSKLYLQDPYRKFGKKTVYQILDDADAIAGGITDIMWGNPRDGDGFEITANKDNVSQAANAFYFDSKSEKAKLNRPGQLGMLPIGTFKTIALLDGFNPHEDNNRVARQRVLDFFTFNPPREAGTDGSSDATTGQPHRGAIHQSKLNINPPRAYKWKTYTEDGKTRTEFVQDGYNMRPLTAALMGCPLREWDTGSTLKIDWNTAELLADGYAKNLDRDDAMVRSEDVIEHWNCDGAAHDVSVLGRSASPNYEGDDDFSWDVVLRKELRTLCDFDREGVLRNSSELFTTRQQLFTILLKADSFTPKSGFNDASHGTSLASVHAIAHIWRDPEPLRDATGRPIRDRDGNAIHPWVLLDLSQF